MGIRQLACPLAIILTTTAVTPAMTATATGTFNVRITITAQCVVSASDLDFGTRGVLNTDTDATNTISVQCTNTLPFSIGLNAGSGTGATVANRLMTGGTATIGYTIYSNAARTAVWGNTPPTDTVAGTGTGAVQTFTAYGRVPIQATPVAGTYTDIVTVTVTY